MLGVWKLDVNDGHRVRVGVPETADPAEKTKKKAGRHGSTAPRWRRERSGYCTKIWFIGVTNMANSGQKIAYPAILDILFGLCSY